MARSNPATLRARLAGAAFFVLVACSGSTPPGATDDPAAPGDGGAPSASGLSTSAVPEILRFEVTGLDGEPIRGADLAGRELAIWFWAPW